MSAIDQASMTLARNRNAIFMASAALSAVACVNVAASMFAAIPDSPSMVKDLAWAVASGVQQDGSAIKMFSGLQSVVKETDAVNSITAWKSTDCPDMDFCADCEGASSGIRMSLVSAMMVMGVSIYAQYRRATMPVDSEDAKKTGVLAGLTSAAALLFSLMSFARNCYANTPDSNNGIMIQMEQAFGPGFQMVALSFVAQCLVAAAHAFTPVLRFAGRCDLAQQLNGEAASLNHASHSSRKFMPPAVPAVARARALNAAGKSQPAEFDPRDMEGVTEIFPGFWDPLNFSRRASMGGEGAEMPFAGEQRLRWFREAELKHGRICMLAALGLIVQENFHPLFGGNLDFPGAKAGDVHELDAFWGPVLSTIFLIEITNAAKSSTNGVFYKLNDQYENGDLDFDPLGLKPEDPAELKEVKTKELNNGRLAMLGIAGMLAQENVDGKKVFSQAITAVNDDRVKVRVPGGFTGGANVNPSFIGAAGAEDGQGLDLDHVMEVAKEMVGVFNETASVTHTH